MEEIRSCGITFCENGKPEAASVMPSIRMRPPRPDQLRRKAPSMAPCCFCEERISAPAGDKIEGFSIGIRLTTALLPFRFIFFFSLTVEPNPAPLPLGFFAGGGEGTAEVEEDGSVDLELSNPSDSSALGRK